VHQLADALFSLNQVVYVGSGSGIPEPVSCPNTDSLTYNKEDFKMTKFFCDDNLGRLAKWLRTLGYDTSFQLTMEDGELVSLALKEDRMILSRDAKLSRFKIEDRYLLIRSEKPLEQLKQVVDHFKLKIDKDLLFSRCLVCNQVLQKVQKEKIKDRLYPYVYQTQDNYVYCSACDRIYWPATHVGRMTEKLCEAGII